MIAQGSPRTVFRSAIAHENLVLAEFSAQMLGSLTLAEALELTALVAVADWRRSSRYASRWFARWIDETPLAGENAAIVAASLAALGGPRHSRALATLRGLVVERSEQRMPEPVQV